MPGNGVVTCLNNIDTICTSPAVHGRTDRAAVRDDDVVTCI